MFFEKMQTRKNDGFTLVELIVVIAILAILAGIAVPAYSGYIEKANVAADEQLLHAVNTAFLSACSYEGVDVSSLTSGTATIDISNGITLTKPESAIATFDEFMGESKSNTFKLIASLYFDTNTSAFKAGSGAYLSLAGKFSQDDIDAFNGGFFSEIGFDSLLGQVDMATQVALAADPNSTLGKMVFSEANMAALAAHLGYDMDDPEQAAKFDAAFQALATERFNQLVAAGADVSTEEAHDAVFYQATQEVLANNAVLSAATNSAFNDKDDNAVKDFRNQLIAGNGKDTIKTSMDTANGDTQLALSQTAMAYALYTSYVERQGGTPSNNYLDVLDVLETKEFMAYMETDNATADLNSYLAAMNMMEDVSKGEDKTPISNLLVNGFNDPELIAALTQEVSK